MTTREALEALIKHGRHSGVCRPTGGNPNTCSCGWCETWTAAVEALSKELDSEHDDGCRTLTIELRRLQVERLLGGATLEGDITLDVGQPTLDAMKDLVLCGDPMIYHVKVID